MAFQQVPAGNGLQWLTDAVQLILKQPAPYALMGLLLAVVSLVPMLGAVALVVLGPALYGGIIFAAREQQSGRAADFQHLFQAFREQGMLGKMLMLCVPGLVAGAIIVVLFAMVLGGALLGAGLAGGNAPGTAVGLGIGAGVLVVGLVALALWLAAFALTFFAVPRVMLESADPVAAMKDSLQACLANIGAVLVYALVLFAAACVLAIVAAMIPVLGQLAMTTVMVPVMAVASYLAWRQVYRHDITQELPPATPPEAP